MYNLDPRATAPRTTKAALLLSLFLLSTTADKLQAKEVTSPRIGINVIIHESLNNCTLDIQSDEKIIQQLSQSSRCGINTKEIELARSYFSPAKNSIESTRNTTITLVITSP
jgi:hypothetical protein